MAQDTIAQRRVQERLDRLVGERGSPDDRAVTVRELRPLLERIARLEASLAQVRGDHDQGVARRALNIDSNLVAFMESIAESVETELESEELEAPDEPEREEYNVLRDDVVQIRESTVRMLSAMRRISAMLSVIIRQSR